ncbi:MAG: hypothetical protein DLM62_16410 [Pseudonocardiales bacterium]|nr:MAG: hypothetical protein DLM62_16410 [Pseudonocardiales bacterium]
MRGRVLHSDPLDDEVVAEQESIRRGSDAPLGAQKLHVLDCGGEDLPLEIIQLMDCRACLIAKPAGETALERGAQERAMPRHGVYVVTEPGRDAARIGSVVDG